MSSNVEHVTFNDMLVAGMCFARPNMITDEIRQSLHPDLVECYDNPEKFAMYFPDFIHRSEGSLCERIIRALVNRKRKTDIRKLRTRLSRANTLDEIKMLVENYEESNA